VFTKKLILKIQAVEGEGDKNTTVCGTTKTLESTLFVSDDDDSDCDYTMLCVRATQTQINTSVNFSSNFHPD
jgi:hypothetical protein